jgi:hypothetical protein
LELRPGRAGDGLEVDDGRAAPDVEGIFSDAFIAGTRALDSGKPGEGVLDMDALSQSSTTL